MDPDQHVHPRFSLSVSVLEQLIRLRGRWSQKCVGFIMTRLKSV
jgi:hypothetical protein